LPERGQRIGRIWCLGAAELLADYLGIAAGMVKLVVEARDPVHGIHIAHDLDFVGHLQRIGFPGAVVGHFQDRQIGAIVIEA